MANYLRVQDGVAVELWTAPDGKMPVDCFPAALADTFHPADDAAVGWLWSNGSFVAPPAAAPLASAPQYNFLGFLSLFTPAEQAAIVASDNGQIRLFCLMAAGANFVDLADPRVVTGTEQLENLGLIGKGRAAQVLAGNPADN